METKIYGAMKELKTLSVFSGLTLKVVVKIGLGGHWTHFQYLVIDTPLVCYVRTTASNYVSVVQLHLN